MSFRLREGVLRDTLSVHLLDGLEWRFASSVVPNSPCVSAVLVLEVLHNFQASEHLLLILAE